MCDWIVDIAGRRVEHISGLALFFEGVPNTAHFNGTPRNYSKTMNPLELSRVIREGFAVYQAEWQRTLGSLASDIRTVPEQN